MRKYIAVLCAAFFISGCAGMSYSNRFDPEAQFGQLNTYQLLPIPENKKDDTRLLLKNLRFAVDKTLQTKGYTQGADNPDFLVAIHAMTEKMVDVQQYGYAYSPNFYSHPAYLDRRWEHDPYYQRGHIGPEFYEYRSGVDVYEYRVGTLIVDIVRADKKDLIWRGIARGVLKDNITPEYIGNIVTNILKGFPPPSVR